MDEDFREFLDIFREESLERLVNVSRALEELGDAGGDRAGALEEVDRELHTIKGSARLLGFEALGKLVHDLEGLARRYRDHDDVPLELLVEAADTLSALVERAASGGEDQTDEALSAKVARAVEGDGEGGAGSPAVPSPAPDAPAPASPPPPAPAPAEPPPPVFLEPPAPAPGEAGGLEGSQRPSRRLMGGEDEQVRVRASRLLDLDGIVSDLSLTHLRLNSHEAELIRLLHDVEGGGVAPSGVAGALRMILQSYARDSTQVRRSARTLQRLAVDVRLRPVEALFDHLPREARDLARKLGKLVKVRIVGGETEIDRVILQRLKTPLSHLVRNAVDHGIEDPADRLARGKDPQGSLELIAGHEGGQVVIRVRDDGGGIDPAAVRRMAAQRGGMDPGALAELADEDVVQLIFTPGLSTRQVASQISGRGVGMDVVRNVVEDLGGDVWVDSTLGEETETTIRLPLTQLISRVTFVRSQGQQFAISTESLLESVLLPNAKVTSFAEREAVMFMDRPIPLVRLSALLGHRLLPDPANLSVLVLRHAGDLLALVIEELLEERSVVVKPLGWPLERLSALSGAVHLPSGEIALLLHVPDLFNLARAGLIQLAGPDGGERRTILVVDDSIVSRQMVSRYVEALGFDLITAVDGLDAWGILERGVQPDLVVTDVEMPRLGGLGLARRIRSHERLRTVPVIIVSTRGSDADRQAGLEAGADAYLTKSELGEKSFRNLIERLL